jgi:hypothetical protein
MFNWLRDLFKPKGTRVDLRLLSYQDADRLLLTEDGWQIAPEEDTNRRIGYVWLERIAKLNGTAGDTGGDA